jgi:hypothetical protein
VYWSWTDRSLVYIVHIFIHTYIHTYIHTLNNMQNVNCTYWQQTHYCCDSGKWQTCPLVRESAPHQKACNCQTVIKIWSKAPDGCFIPRQTGRLTVGRNITLTLEFSWEFRCGVLTSGQRHDHGSWRISTVTSRWQVKAVEDTACWKKA